MRCIYAYCYGSNGTLFFVSGALQVNTDRSGTAYVEVWRSAR
jgi:hypothetical protein